MTIMDQDRYDRLMRHVRVDPDGCWAWTGAMFCKGYGNFRWSTDRNVSAHRAMYEVLYGPIPGRLVVMHLCDNPPCCRPDHLRLGTYAENTADMIAKGRSPDWDLMQRKGTDNPAAKLTDDQVREIRSSSEPRRRIAERYGIALASVYNIRSRRTWGHLA